MTPTDPLTRRRLIFGPGMHLSYDRPVHAVSARGVWITEADGTELLDAYNNVPHVGHGRPEVVQAIAAQAALLNTNTRYLVDAVTEYAERLTSLLPPFSSPTPAAKPMTLPGGSPAPSQVTTAPSSPPMLITVRPTSRWQPHPKV